MTRRPHDVSIWEHQDRRGWPRTKKPWVARWSVDGQGKSKAFLTKTAADDFTARIRVAARDGEPFNAATGMPAAWSAEQTPTLFEWAQQWIDEQATTWGPRTLESAVEALARWIPLATSKRSPAPPPQMRRYLVEALTPGSQPHDRAAAAWLARWSPQLSKLTKEDLAASQQALILKDDGTPASRNTASRLLNTAHACLKRAVELEIISEDPWPARPHGHSRRKAVKATEDHIDIARLPSPETMKKIIAAIRSHQPQSHQYATMTAIAFFAGLRPSEVVDLAIKHLELPETGWGTIKVREADIGTVEPGTPKTGNRDVPIPPVLVGIIRDYIEAARIKDRLFRTRSGARPTNWGRALDRATASIGVRRINPYDCRHACATFLLRSGVPMAETARRMGHSVPVLVKHYARVFETDAALANQKIEDALEADEA